MRRLAAAALRDYSRLLHRPTLVAKSTPWGDDTSAVPLSADGRAHRPEWIAGIPGIPSNALGGIACGWLFAMIARQCAGH